MSSHGSLGFPDQSSPTTTSGRETHEEAAGPHNGNEQAVLVVSLPHESPPPNCKSPQSSNNKTPRKYATNLDPLSTLRDVDAEADLEELQSGLSTASTECDESQTSFDPSPASVFMIPTKSFMSHRTATLSNLTQTYETLQKSFPQYSASSGQQTASTAVSLTSTLNNTTANEKSRLPSSRSPGQIKAGLSELYWSGRKPSTAQFATMRSPCFFHQRFDDAVNIDKVLEEIAAEDDGMSHSRLMQTATSVREISKQLQRRPIKRAVRTVMIVTKARDNSLVQLTRDLTEWLMATPRYNSDFGVSVYVDAKLRNSKRFNATTLLAMNPRFKEMLHYWDADLCWTSPEKFDLVLTLGGDGTVLYTSCIFQRVVPPILAFSLGSLGFLTNFEYATYKESLNRILGESGMRVNLRMRFACTVYRANPNQSRSAKIDPVKTTNMIEGEQFEVLNELVIDRGPSPYVSNLELYGDDELLTVVQADGCIFSTPTGSTAYSLSAGGPLTHPSIPAILLTPICPHTLSFRPMVLSDSLLLKVCVPRNSRSTAYASFDGKGRVELRRGDCVQVEAGRYPFPTVVGEGGTGGEWFESVRRALRWNTRGAVQKGFHAKMRMRADNAAMPAGMKIPPEAFWEEDRDDDNEEEEEEEAEEWDINPDPIELHSAGDSGLGYSEQGSVCGSPLRRLEGMTL